MDDKHILSLYDSSLRFLDSLTRQEAYGLIAEEAKKLVKARDASVFVKEDGAFKRVSTTNPELNKIIPRQRGITYTVFTENQPYISTKGKLVKYHPEFKKINIGSEVAVPLSFSGQILGVLTVHSLKGKEFDKIDFQFLRLFAPLATLAVRKALLLDELERALRTRDLFLSAAAHELRTPLTSVYLYSQIIEKKIKKKEAVNKQYIRKMLGEERRLIKLIDQFLDISKIDEHKLTFEINVCDLREIIGRALFNVEQTHKDYRFIYENKIKRGIPRVKADFDKLIGVFINLLNNAAKYSSPGKPILISLYLKGRNYLVSVRDKGRGIDSSDLPYVFNRYYKGKDSPREGMGLGLYLARQIIDRCGGKIEISSRKNYGTTVNILLPKVKKNE